MIFPGSDGSVVTSGTAMSVEFSDDSEFDGVGGEAGV